MPPKLIPTSSASTRAVRVVTSAAFLVVAALWIVFAAEEPLHIDELRQTAVYSGDIREWISRSVGMNQPPMEITLGAVWRRLFGSSDYIERLFPVIVGLASIILLSRLSVRFSGRMMAAPIAILAYGLSPLVFRTTVLIRPYALPTFFSLLFLTALINLRNRGPSRLRVISAIASGAGLLFSHALIPFLVSSLAASGLFAMKLRGRSDSHGAAVARRIALSVALVGLFMPIALRVRNPVFFESSFSYSLLERIGDALDAAAAAFRSSMGWAIIPVTLSLVLLMVPTFRPEQNELWWFVALLGIPVGISAVFFATVAPGFSYPDRYLHDIMLTGAIGISLVGSRWASHDPRPKRNLIFGAIGIAIAGSYLALSVPAFRTEVTTERNLDWADGADLVMASVDPGTVILFEPLVPFPSYQPLFYGQPRYLPASHAVSMSRLVVGSGHMLGDGPIAVLLVGSQATTIDPPGWRTEQQGIWELLIPPPTIEYDTVAVLRELDAAITDERYDVVLRIHLAIELAEDGDVETARTTLEGIDRPSADDPQQLFDSYLSKAAERIAVLSEAR